MTHELTVQDSPAAVLAAALREIQNRHIAARLDAAALAAEESAAPMAPNRAPAAAADTDLA